MEQIKKHLPELQVQDIQNLYREFELTFQEKETAVEVLKFLKQRANDDTEITEFEIESAYLDKRKEKRAHKNLVDYKQKLFSERSQSIPKYTAEEYLEMISKIDKFDIDEWNEDLIWKLCLYFSEDVRSTLNPEKGIYMMGPVGCGKSKLMDFFSKNYWNSYVIYPCLTISEWYQKDGISAIERLRWPFKVNLETFGQKEIGICFDDLGTEVDKKNWGNESNVLCDLLLSRYNNKKVLCAKTHITTNYNTTELEERYGSRVRSRLRELCNVLIFEDNAPDRRK